MAEFGLGKLTNSIGLGSFADSVNRKANNVTNSVGNVTSKIMANTVKDLRDGIDRHGSLARTNKFFVLLRTPESSLFNKNALSVAYGLSNGFVQSFLDDPRDIGILCESVTLPASNLNTFDYGLEGHSQKMVNGFNNTEFSMTFTVTNDYFIPRMFKGWETSIVNRKSNRIKYKDSYTRDIRVICYDDNNIPNYVLKISKAFPIQQSEMVFDKNDLNNYQRYTITFSYEDFEEYGVSELFGDLKDAVSDGLKSVTGFFNDISVDDSKKLFGGITSTPLPDIFQAQGNPVGTITSSSLPVLNNQFGTNLITDAIRGS